MELKIEEIIAVIAVLLFGYFIIKKISGLFRKKAKASDVHYLGEIKTRIVQNINNRSPFLDIQCKGLIPVCSKTNVGFTVSIFTEDDSGRTDVVLSIIDTFQEPDSRAFQDLTRIGEVDEHDGFENWTTVCKTPLHMLQPSIGGKKKLKIVIMLVDIEKPPKIVFGSGERGILVFVKDYSYNFNIKGYDEEGSHINEARALSIRIGVAVAMSDGDFDDKERKTLDIWIKKMIMPFNQEKQLELKKLYNNAKNKAEQEFANLGHDKKAWEVELNAICRELHDINEDVQKYE
ncbi:hypothetical protein HN615_00765, partial [Candidatus Woesearchaeota archaeon]|nr:hypothetical protein [Candidatus Woesearchaeota archaeon]